METQNPREEEQTDTNIIVIYSHRVGKDQR